MEPQELTALLREVEPDQAAELIARMEPDEAVDALRDLSDEEQSVLLARMPQQVQRELVRLLGYPGDEAAGIMTTCWPAHRPTRRWRRSASGWPSRRCTGPRSTRWPCSMRTDGCWVISPPSTCWSATATGGSAI